MTEDGLQGMDSDLRVFLSVAFSAEVVGSMESVRKDLPLQGEESLAKLRAAFRDLVENRRLSLREWAMTTDLDFDTADGLYHYLGAMYDYLFEGAETLPEPSF